MTKGIGQVKLSGKLSGKLSVKLSSKKTQKWVTDHSQLLLIAAERRKEKERMKPVPKRYILFTRHDKIFYFYRPTNKIFYLLVMLQIDGLVLNVCVFAVDPTLPSTH